MNKKRRALSGFKKMRDDELLAQSNSILESLQFNEFFPETTPELAVLIAKIEDYTKMLSKSKQKGSPFDTSMKDEARARLEAILVELAFHVNKIAQGNLSIILSTGFMANSVDSTLFEPSIIYTVLLSDGRQSGQIRLDFEKLENVRIYEYCYTSEKDKDGELEWGEIFKTTSSKSNIISPVIPGTRYYVRVRAVNTKGIGDWSEAVSRMAR